MEAEEAEAEEVRAALLPLAVVPEDFQARRRLLLAAELPGEGSLLGSSRRADWMLGAEVAEVKSHKRLPEQHQPWMQRWKNRRAYASCGAMYMHWRRDV